MGDAASPSTSPIRLDDLPLPMAALDERLRVSATNRAFEALTAHAPGGMVGRDVIELLTAAAEFAERLAGDHVFHVRLEADDRWLRLDLQPHRGGMLALLIDITAERRALEELSFANQTRADLMRDADVGVWRYDPEQQVYQVKSRAGDDYMPDTVALHEVVRALHPDDAVIDAENRERLTRDGGSAEHELRRRAPGGTWEHMQINCRSGRLTPSGLYEMYGLSQNVTAVAVARDEAQAAAKRLKLALNAANAAVFEYDYEARWISLSPEFAALLAEDLLAASDANQLLMFHEHDHDALRELDQRLLGGLKSAATDVRVMTRDGPRWMRIILEAQPDADGRMTRSIGLAIDIHDQKRQELALTEARRAAEAATEAKSMFLASMSHEIRTPMNGIVGVLNLLKREALSADGLHLLNEALACSGMLGQLINDVLDFSKIEAGKLDLSPEACDPVVITQSVASLLAPQAHAKHLRLGVSAANDMGGALIDPVRLRQCLFNVIGNAVKFTDRGGVEIRLAYLGEGAGRRLRCEVSDTGVGVPIAAREQMFDRFRQADAGATRRFGGTGLGLAISRSLTRMMGGDMDFESEEGRGSTFWFEVSAPPARASAAGDNDAFAGAPLAGLNVLVVDDNATNRLVAVKSLEALGAQASAVDNGEAAIAAAIDGFDLILMDVNMPRMDGLEATQRIRALPSPAAHTPVIALTADVMTHQQASYLAAGMNGVVSKPFSPARLLAEIARLVQGETAPAAAAVG